MPGAGFYAIHNSQIVFGRDGNWYADGQRIENRRIAALFSRSVHRRAEGGYELRIADERAAIEVEDTPYVVLGLRPRDNGGGADVELNDGSVEALVPASLRVGVDHVLYCRVRGGAERARFTRAAYNQIASSFREIEAGRFALELGGSVHPIARD